MRGFPGSRDLDLIQHLYELGHLENGHLGNEWRKCLHLFQCHLISIPLFTELFASF